MRHGARGVLAAVLILAAIGAPTLRAQPADPAPPPRAHGPAPPLGPRQAWIPGHWRWNGMRYVWRPGRIVDRASGGHRWVPGHWARAMPSGGRVWRPGHWQ